MNNDQLAALGDELSGIKDDGFAGTFSGVTSSPRFGKILNRFVIPFANTDTIKTFDVSAIKDIQRVSVRVATRIPQANSGSTVLGTGDEVFPFMGSPTLSATISIGRANTPANTNITVNPVTGAISLALDQGSTYNTGIIVITEYDFDYTYLGSVTYNTTGTAAYVSQALNADIVNLDNVFVSNMSDFQNATIYEMAFNGTFQPSGYYDAASTFMDIPMLWHTGQTNYYSSGGFFVDSKTFRFYRELFMQSSSFVGKIFEIKARR